jgi:tRNA pseudouridine55 synthase
MAMIVAINKPMGPSSFGIVSSIRKITGIKRVGHAGTLDPLASGVLVIGIGREATRSLSQIVDKDKEYITTITLGANSTTDDARGLITHYSVLRAPQESFVGAVVRSYIGMIDQVPPNFSAINIAGKRAYELASRGKEVVLKSRKVFVKSIDILSYTYPTLRLHVTCGPGVYIRSLARDIGENLSVGGYVEQLERTRVGIYTIEKSMTIDQFTTYWKTHADDQKLSVEP